MDEKDKEIKELREQIKLMQSDIEYLHNLLDEAKVLYTKNTSSEISNSVASIKEVN